MNNDNDENNNNQTQDTLIKELSALTEYYLPDGILVKGIENLTRMKNNVLELDNVLLDLAKTSNLTASELKNITQEAFQMGDAVGSSGIKVLSYITSANKAGYDMQESLALAEEALKMSNISSGIDSASDAMNHLKTIVDNFNENTDFASTINDALTGVSKTGAVDFDTLAQGALTLSESAGKAGLSFEEMLGLLTGAYSILKDMDQVSGGELAIFSKLKETYGDARNVYDILAELNNVWNTLDEPSREAFAISTVGDDQKEVFAALMDNWQGVESAVSSASDSFGAANDANNVYLDSITGKTAEFQNQVEKLSASLMDSGILKFFLKLSATGTGALNAVTERLGPLGSLATLGSGYLGAKGLGQHTCCDTFGCEAQESFYCYV